MPHSHITLYPIPGEAGAGAADEPGDRLMNYVWYRNVPAGPELSEMLIDKRGIPGKVSLHPGQVQDRYVDEMRAAAARMLAPAAAEVVTATATPYVQVVQDVRSSRMADGRVALIGDAACGARPHAAAGTAKAAADAWALSAALEEADGDVAAALRKWEPAPAGAELAPARPRRRHGRALAVPQHLGPRRPEPALRPLRPRPLTPRGETT